MCSMTGIISAISPMWTIIVKGVAAVVDQIAAPDLSWESDHPNPSTSSAPFRIYNIMQSKAELSCCVISKC